MKFAIELARRACEKHDAPVACQVVLARGLIKAKDWASLEAVRADLRKRKGDNQPVLQRLAVHEALARKQWRRAEQAIERIGATPSRQSLRAAMLELKAQDYSVLLNERGEATAQALAIRRALGPLRDEMSPEQLEMYE